MGSWRLETAGLNGDNGGCRFGVYSYGENFVFERRGGEARLKIGGDQGYVDWLPNGRVKVGWRAIDWAMYAPDGRLECVVMDIVKLLSEAAESVRDEVYWADCQKLQEVLADNQSLALMVSFGAGDVAATVLKFNNHPSGEREAVVWGLPSRLKEADKELAALGVSGFWGGVFPELATILVTYVYRDYISVGCQTKQGRFIGHVMNLTIRMVDFDDTQNGIGEDMVRRLFRSAVRH